jgi:hypothetical protein
MKVKLKHRLRDGRLVEIEGEPNDVAHTAHELDKARVVESGMRPDAEPGPSISGAAHNEKIKGFGPGKSSSISLRWKSQR